MQSFTTKWPKIHVTRDHTLVASDGVLAHVGRQWEGRCQSLCGGGVPFRSKPGLCGLELSSAGVGLRPELLVLLRAIRFIFWTTVVARYACWNQSYYNQSGMTDHTLSNFHKPICSISLRCSLILIHMLDIRYHACSRGMARLHFCVQETANFRKVVNPYPEVRSSGRVQNIALYRSARPDPCIRICFYNLKTINLEKNQVFSVLSFD